MAQNAGLVNSWENLFFLTRGDKFQLQKNLTNFHKARYTSEHAITSYSSLILTIVYDVDQSADA